MKPSAFAVAAAAALLLGHLQLTAAEATKFRHLTSVYVDEKGTGLKLPEGVACDAKGRLVIGDTGNDRLLRFTFQNKALSGGSEIKIPELSAPSRVELNSKGDIYALDSKRRRIVHLGADGAFKSTVSFEGAGSAAEIIPKSFAIDSADNLYVLDVFSARVLVLNAEGQVQKTLALPSDAGFVSDVAVDYGGTVLVLDSVKRRLFSAAKGVGGFEPLGGELADSLITLPTDMITADGTIFVVEGLGSSVVSFGRDGAFVARQLTMGRTEGMLNHPSQMCINDKSEMFIADRDNSRIQVFGLIR